GDIWSVHANADLSRILIASETSNRVGTSTDGGNTFVVTPITLEFPNSSFRDVLVIDDNIAIIGGVGGDYIYRTTNFGSSWASITAPGLHNWGSFVMSDDRSKILASSHDATYLSTDQGATWTIRTNNSPAGQHQYSFAASADFSVIYSYDEAT